jgi:hypothetical protein
LDYRKSTLSKALDITTEIFENIEHSRYMYKGYEVCWMLYNLVHIGFSIPYAEIENMNDFQEGTIDLSLLPTGKHLAARIYATQHDFKVVEQKPLPGHALRVRLSIIYKILQDILLLCYSLVSIAYLKIRKRKPVGLWTGDFYDPRNNGDFRLGNLFKKMADEGIDYIEFIRRDANGFKHCIDNMKLRRRIAVYYSSLIDLHKLVSPGTKFKVHLKNENSFHRDVLEAYAFVMDGYENRIVLFKKIFKFIGLSYLIAWEYSDRQSLLIYAAKSLGIPVLGFMHGAGMKTYMAHEFITPFKGEKKIGPDVMGVWSEWWKQYYEQNSEIYGRVEVSGTLRKNSSYGGGDLSKKDQVILWISEPLVEPDDVIDYMCEVRRKFELIIKKRPFTNDIFYNKLIERYPEMADCKVMEGDIHKAIAASDVVIGSHSTAVIEASLQDKPCILVKTGKWGDYFELSGVTSETHCYITSPEEITPLIKKHLASDRILQAKIIREMFFGDENMDGVIWTINQLRRI